MDRWTFSLPGTGHITKDESCGSWSKTIACSQNPKHYLKTFAYNCGHIECPVCWEMPVGKSAKKASSRIRGYADVALRTGMKSQVELLVNHFVASPPEGLILPGMENDKIKEYGRKIAKKAGIYGGVMAFHPYRIKKDVARQLQKQCADNYQHNPEAREKKYWELVRANALGMDSWQDYVYWSPHFHYIGFGKLPDQNTPEEKAQVKKLYKGWFVKWIRHVDDSYSFNGTDIDDPIAELAFYLFSHAGYQAGHKIPVWLGVCSPNKLVVIEKQKQEYQVVCPVCNSPVVVGSEIQGAFVPRVENGEWVTHTHRCTEIIYGIRKKFKRKSKYRFGLVWPPQGEQGFDVPKRDPIECYTSEKSSDAFKDLADVLSWIGISEFQFWRVYTR